MHGSYHAEVNSTTVRDLMVLSVSNLLLSAMVGSYHVCVNLSNLCSRLVSHRYCALVGSPSPTVGHGARLRGRSVFMKYLNALI